MEKTNVAILIHVPKDVHNQYKIKKIKLHDTRPMAEIYANIITENLKNHE